MTRRRGLALSLLFLSLVLAGGALGFLVGTRLVLGVTLARQPVTLALPDRVEAEVRALSPAQVRLDGLVSARVPLRQTIPVPLRGDYEAEVAFDADIPLRTTVRYQGRVPVETGVSLAGSTGLVVDRSWLPKFPLRAQVPLRFEIPVDLVVPLETTIRLAYRGPVRFSLDQRLDVPVDAVIASRFPLARDAEAPLLAAFRLRAQPQQAEVPAVIERADLRLPLGALRWHWRK